MSGDGVNGAAVMRAAVLTGPGKQEVRRVALPDPGRGQVRVRLEGCGVCASNLTPWAGPDRMEFPTPPGGLGHEGWGVVDAVFCQKPLGRTAAEVRSVVEAARVLDRIYGRRDQRRI